MAKYMVMWDLPSETRNEAIKRFAAGGAEMEAPDGVTLVTRWHAVDGGSGFSVVETDDPKGIADWLLHWTDILTYQVVPVITDDELGELLQKHS